MTARIAKERIEAAVLTAEEKLKSAGLITKTHSFYTDKNLSESTEFLLPKESKVYATFGCRNPNCNTKLNGYDALCYESTYAEYDPKERFIPTEYVREKDCLIKEEHFNYVLFPMTVKYKDGTFGALMESDVYNYLGSNLLLRNYIIRNYYYFQIPKEK